MATLSQAIEAAAKLPLNDAAYSLWMQKWQLDCEERPSPQGAEQRQDLADPEIFGRAVRDAIANVRKEQESAHNGATFLRLKVAHPGATAQALQNAIKSAVKLDADCTRHFSYSDSGLWQDAQRAIELAREENPNFLDSTYKSAVLYMCQAMR
jgi:hypothetical protein